LAFAAVPIKIKDDPIVSKSHHFSSASVGSGSKKIGFLNFQQICDAVKHYGDLFIRDIVRYHAPSLQNQCPVNYAL
jgi:hypothetical protein